jgi:CheY-like chemotaxis protein
MPELNGYQVLSIVARDARFQGIPIVMLSTSNSPEHIRRCEEQGAIAYFIKPHTINGFEGIAQNILSLCN